MRTLAVVGIVAVVGGLGTWLTAPSNTVVIGASGLVFGFATYLVARGAYSRTPWHIVGGLVVLVIYGSTLLVGLVPTPGVSWQGHLFGALGGLLAARVLHRARPARRVTCSRDGAAQGDPPRRGRAGGARARLRRLGRRLRRARDADRRPAGARRADATATPPPSAAAASASSASAASTRPCS